MPIQTVLHTQNQGFVQKSAGGEQLMLKKNNKTLFYCEKRTFMVPSGTIKEVTPTGTSALLDRLACKGGKNQKPRYWRKNADFPRRTRWTTTIAAKTTRFAQVRRTGDGRSGIRTGTAAHRRKHCRCVRPLSGPSVPASVVSASVRPSVTGASVRALCRKSVCSSVRQKFVHSSVRYKKQRGYSEFRIGT